MKHLNPNERRLLLLFLAACGVAACLLGAKTLGNVRQSLQVHLKELREQDITNKQWISAKSLWESRAKWMEDHPAPKANAETAASDLLSHLQESAAAQGGKILEQGFSPARRQGRYDTVTVHVKVSGPFGSLAKWLFSIQQAESYFGIRKISFKGDGEPPQVVCDVEITQYLQSE